MMLRMWFYSARIPQIVKNFRERSCEGDHLTQSNRHVIVLTRISRVVPPLFHTFSAGKSDVWWRCKCPEVHRLMAPNSWSPDPLPLCFEAVSSCEHALADWIIG